MGGASSQRHLKQMKWRSPLSIASEPGGASFTPFLLLQSRWKGHSGICPGWWTHKPCHVKWRSIPESFHSDGEKRQSYWFTYAFLTSSLFLCICFKCIPFFWSKLHLLIPLPVSGTLFHKSSPPLLQFSLLLLFFNRVFLKKINIFIYFWLHWVFVAACGLSLVVVSGGYSVAVCGLLFVVASLVEHGL